MQDLLKKIEEKLPHYEVQKKIKQKYFDEYDTQFYIQIRNFNVIVTIVYSIGVLMELLSGVQSIYLVLDIIFILFSAAILILVAYAHFSQKIMINYWISILLLLRICVGLVQIKFPGLNFNIGSEALIIWGFNSFTTIDSILYLIINVSHKNKILAPIIIYMIAIMSLYIYLFSVIRKPQIIQEWIVYLFFCTGTVVSVMYKLYLQKNIQEYILLSMQNKQESKEYILEMLQEGIMIISKKIDKKNQNQCAQKSKSGMNIQENEYKIEFMNKVFKNMLGIKSSQLQIDCAANREIVQILLNNEILEEHVEINNDHNEQSGEKLIDISNDLSNKVFNLQQNLYRQNSPQSIINQMEQQKSFLLNKKNQMYSISKLLLLDQDEVSKKTFILIDSKQEDQNASVNKIEQNKENKKRFVQIKIHKRIGEDMQEIAIQIIDISVNIINQQIQNDIYIENKLRGFTCHEVRNPLNSIINSVERIEEFLNEIFGDANENDQIIEENPQQRIKKNLQILKFSSKILKFFVSDMLDFQLIKAKILQKDIQNINLHQTINEVVMMMDYTAKNNKIKVVVEYEKQDIFLNNNFMIRTDGQRLQQIILNLLSNSLKYTQPGGFVKIILDIIKIQNSDQEIEKKFLKVVVWDNGNGISPQDQQKLFKLFGTKQNDQGFEKKGIGFGLCICKNICEQFEGNISLVSDQGVGSIFTFIFKIDEIELEDFDNNFINKIDKVQNIGNFIFLDDNLVDDEENKVKKSLDKRQQFYEDIQISQESGSEGKQLEIQSSQMNQIMRDILKSSKNSKKEYLQQEDESNKKNYFDNNKNIIDQQMSQELKNPKNQELRLKDYQTQQFSLKQPILVQEFELMDYMDDKQQIQLDRRAGTFIEQGKDSLEFKKVSQNIRSKFNLKKQEDLIAQFKEFQDQPLVDINQLPELSNYAASDLSQINNKKKQISQIKKFYQELQIKNLNSEIDIQNNDFYVLQDSVDKFLYRYQSKKFDIFKGNIIKNDTPEEFKEGESIDEDTERQYSYKKDSEYSKLNFLNEENQVQLSCTNFIIKNQLISDIENQNVNLRNQKPDDQIINHNQINFQINNNSKKEILNDQSYNQINKNKEKIQQQDCLSKQQINQKDEMNIKKQQKGPRIMIVDDVFFNIEIMKDVLGQVLKIDIENDVVDANNGKEAVVKYLQLHKMYKRRCPIEIILMDCDMPVMNGFRATEYILKFAEKEKKAIEEKISSQPDQILTYNESIQMKIPIIVAVTGDSNQNQQIKAKKAGMKLLVSKPINSADLKKLLTMYKIM